jgi:hypothetical protein
VLIHWNTEQGGVATYFQQSHDGSGRFFVFAFAFVGGCQVRCHDLLSVESACPVGSAPRVFSKKVPEMARNYM